MAQFEAPYHAMTVRLLKRRFSMQKKSPDLRKVRQFEKMASKSAQNVVFFEILQFFKVGSSKFRPQVLYMAGKLMM